VQACGFGAVRFHNRSASFTVTWRGIGYGAVVTLGHGFFELAAASRTIFQSRIPSELLAEIRRLNETIYSGCYLDVISDNGEAFVCARTKMECNRMTLSVFADAMSELVSMAVALDVMLAQEGHAN
jgi:hypothetical protein